MKKLFEINDQDIGLKPSSDLGSVEKTAARAVLIKNDLIALLHVGRGDYFKLPGGGLDPGETVEEAVRREVLEETGCTIDIMHETGEIIERRSRGKMIQTSYCFIARVIKEAKPKFTVFESKNNFKLVWAPIDKAISLIENSRPNDYNGKFIVKRDLVFLQEAEKIIKGIARG